MISIQQRIDQYLYCQTQRQDFLRKGFNEAWHELLHGQLEKVFRSKSSSSEGLEFFKIVPPIKKLNIQLFTKQTKF